LADFPDDDINSSERIGHQFVFVGVGVEILMLAVKAYFPPEENGVRIHQTF